MTATRSYFIAGTDTEIGKTYATCALLHHARKIGLRALGMKPVAAGAAPIDGRLCNDDALALIAAGTTAADYAQVNPICLAEAVAPHIAAADEGRRIDIEAILSARDALSQQCDLLLIEGVGGFRVPLHAGYDTADLAADLAAPVILVVGLRLGCINHALLTADAIRARGLELAGWIANCVDPLMRRREQNIAALDERLGCARLGILPHAEGGDAVAGAVHLQLPAWHQQATDAIVVLDCAASMHGGHRGRVVVTGSHGGASAARYALRAGARLCFFNDAGGGKADAGTAALAALQQAGLAAACYAHDSARIGDGRDGFGHGLISAVNDTAAAMGLRVGMSFVEGASRASGASA